MSSEVSHPSSASSLRSAATSDKRRSSATGDEKEARPSSATLKRSESRQTQSSAMEDTVVEMVDRDEAKCDVDADADSVSAGDSIHRRASSDKVDVEGGEHVLPVATPSYPPSRAGTIRDSFARSDTTDPTVGLTNGGKSDSIARSVGGPSAAAALPDGGLRAWLNVLGGFLVLFASFGVVNALGAFQAYYEEFLFIDKSSSDIAWIGSTQLCLFFLCALIAGPLFDKGHFRAIMAFGSTLWILSIFLIPQMKTYGQMLGVQGILGGVGVGFLFLPSMSIQSHWFARRRALAIGIVASGSSVGGVCFPIMLNRLFADPNVGFQSGVRACGYVVAGCLVIANCIMAPNPARKHIKKPPPPPLKEMFSGSFTCLVLGAFLLSFGIWFPNFYEQLYFRANGASTMATTYALAFFKAGSFLGRTIPSLIADYVGPFNVQAVCCFGAGIMIFLMKIMTSQALLIAHAILYGFFSGAFIALVSPITVSIARDLSEIGLRQGIAFLIVAGSSVGCNPIAGRLLAVNNGNFLHPIIFAGTMVIAGSVSMTVGRFLRAKEMGTWRV